MAMALSIAQREQLNSLINDPTPDHSPDERNKGRGQPEQPLAEPWPCKPCGIFLGVAHLVAGLVLMIYDVATNNLSESAFAISASITFIVCGILGLIASRRLDKGTITLWLIFSFMSAGLCLTMFVDSATQLNIGNCPTVKTRGSRFSPGNSNVQLTDGTTKRSTSVENNCLRVYFSIPHVTMLVISVIKLFIDLVTILICIRSLRNWYRPQLEHPESPYKAMIHSPIYAPYKSKKLSVPADQYVTPYTRIMMEYLIDDEH